MAVGSIGNKNMTFDEWLKAENKTGEVKTTQKQQPAQKSELTENGVPIHLADQLHSGKTIWQVAAQNPTKETAGASGVTAAGTNPQPTAGVDPGTKGVDSAVQNDNNNSVLQAGATGHSAQAQGPVVASGLQGAQGNENSSGSGTPTSDSQQLNADLYSQYEAAMEDLKAAENGEAISTGEGTLSTGDVEGADGTGEVDGASGVDGANPTDAPAEAPTAEGAENPSGEETGGETGGEEPPTDTADNSQEGIQKQQEQQQEKILDEKRFKKLEEERAA